MKKISKKIYILLIAALACALLLMTGCAGGSSSNKTSEVTDSSDETWTILMYLCGTDLESKYGYASVNLDEIISAGVSDNVNVIIETGGCSEWKNDYIDPNVIGRYKVTESGLELVDSQKLSNMSNVKTLKKFLKWGVKNYPADHYMSLIWDHGCGSVCGSVYDEVKGSTYNLLSVKEIASAIESTKKQFEVVGFDACLMSTLEQASALCSCADYLVASEETEPGTGWDYKAWLTSLYENTGITGEDLGKIIVDTYYAKCEKNKVSDNCTLSVTDLSKIPALVDAFNEMTTQMKSYTSDVTQIKTITGAFKSAQSCGGNSDNEGYTDMVDLGSLVLDSSEVTADTSEKVTNCLSDAVVYHREGIGRSRDEGLSVYVPLSQNENRFDKYAEEASISGDYLRFISELYDFSIPSDITISTPTVSDDGTITQDDSSKEDYEPADTIDEKGTEIKYTEEINKDGFIEVDVTEGSEIIDAARCNVYWLNEKDNLFYYIGSDYMIDVNNDWTKFTDSFDGVWIYINNCLCEINPTTVSDDVIEYNVPVQVNGKDTNLRISYSANTDKFSVLGLWDGIDENGFASRDFRKLKKGDKVDFVFQAREYLDDEPQEVVVKGFTYKGKIKVKEKDMGNGQYAYNITLDDIFGNSLETKWADIYVEDDKLYAELNY